VLHLIAVRIVRIAHDPFGASAAHDLALFHHVIDPEADVMDADIILAGALRRLVRLEVQDREFTTPSVRNTPSASGPSSSDTSCSPVRPL